MFPAPAVRRQATPHYDAGRDGWPIIGICFHIAQGSRSSVINWFANPTSRVSSHYLVGLDGGIDQFVDVADTAWTQGRTEAPSWPLLGRYPYPNRVLIGIEHEGYTGEPWPEAMYAADLALVAHLCEAHDIRPERPFLLGHCELDTIGRAECPGSTFPWDRLLRDLRLLWTPGLPAWLPPVMLEAITARISDGVRPLEPVTRAEALAMVMRAAGDRLPPAPPRAVLADTPAWLAPYMSQAVGHWITTGADLSGLARRNEVMAMAVRALAAAKHPSTDSPGPIWWNLEVSPHFAQGHGISDGTRPGEICSRGEAMAMAVRLHQVVVGSKT